MRNYKIIISESARQDLTNAYRYIYYDLENPLAAEKFKRLFEKKARSLSDVPFLGEQHTIQTEYRVAHISRYRIFYLVDEANERVTISRIFYSRRDDPKFNDLN